MKVGKLINKIAVSYNSTMVATNIKRRLKIINLHTIILRLPILNKILKKNCSLFHFVSMKTCAPVSKSEVISSSNFSVAKNRKSKSSQDKSSSISIEFCFKAELTKYVGASAFASVEILSAKEHVVEIVFLVALEIIIPNSFPARILMKNNNYLSSVKT